ncbi:MAG: tetratricopeptide repeat protein [Leptolyngbya sp. SIO1D8]|nr:tetratricopeptide repeat protein [Leptolyngbya sp. SIO1D8]
MIRRTCSDSNQTSRPTQKVVPSPSRKQCPYDISVESAAKLRKRVSNAVARRDYSHAIAILNRLLTLYPGQAEDYSNRGLIYLWNGQPQKALLDFNKAIELAPSLASSYNNRANYYATQGARESAIEDYDRAIDLNPFHVRARINRAVTLRELNCYDAALDGFEEALVFRQLIGEIYAERGRTYHLRGDWNGAIADYRRALTVFQTPSDTKAPARHPRWQQITNWLNQLQPAS